MATTHSMKREFAALRTRVVNGERVSLPRLRCPGGPRASPTDIKRTCQVPTAGHLAKFDQRFILNLKLTHDLTRFFRCGRGDDKVFVELGPGAGALTRSLLTQPCHGVLGVELDARFNAGLDAIQAHTDGRFRWVNADVLKVDEAALLEQQFPDFTASLARWANAAQTTDAQRQRREAQRVAAAEKWTRPGWSARAPGEEADPAAAFTVDDEAAGDVAAEAAVGATPFEHGGMRCARHSPLWTGTPRVEVIGNLPFGVAGQAVQRYAVDCARRENFYKYGRVPVHLFFQKEVAERVVAVPGTKEFGRLAVVAQNYFRTSVRATFRERTFYPSAEVLGALVTLEPRKAPLVDVDGSALANFCDVVLRPGRRQGSVLAALKAAVPEEVALYILRDVCVDGSVLPTQLPVVDVARMAALWVRYLEATHQADTDAGEYGEQLRRLPAPDDDADGFGPWSPERPLHGDDL